MAGLHLKRVGEILIGSAWLSCGVLFAMRFGCSLNVFNCKPSRLKSQRSEFIYNYQSENGSCKTVGRWTSISFGSSGFWMEKAVTAAHWAETSFYWRRTCSPKFIPRKEFFKTAAWGAEKILKPDCFCPISSSFSDAKQTSLVSSKPGFLVV